MPALVFIDTNILLDFYRLRGSESDLTILEHLDAHHARIITSSQVEMEFKKNRPNVILATYHDLKTSGWKGLGGLPAFLAKSKQSSALSSSRNRIDTLLKTLRDRTQRILQDPTHNDPVYKVVQRLFRDDTPLNLSRSKDARFTIRRLAAKRFILGYPPRKDSDTSIGDAVNWEWLVRCAADRNSDVVIASRDSDFGIQFEGDPILNDWLSQEFRARVGRKRSITLTNRLAAAFKAAGIKVTKQEEEAENQFLKGREQPVVSPLSGIGLGFPSAELAASLDALSKTFAGQQDALRKALTVQFTGLLGKQPPEAPPPADGAKE